MKGRLPQNSFINHKYQLSGSLPHLSNKIYTSASAFRNFSANSLLRVIFAT